MLVSGVPGTFPSILFHGCLDHLKGGFTSYLESEELGKMKVSLEGWIYRVFTDKYINMYIHILNPEMYMCHLMFLFSNS